MIIPRSILAFGVLVVVPSMAALQPYPVVGVSSGINSRTGEMPVRRNINDIYKESGLQWDLYVEALTAMQDANETDAASYFQIAGIHGQPYMAWPGGGPQSGAEAGYCPHNHCSERGTADICRYTRSVRRCTKPATDVGKQSLILSQQALVGQAKRIANSYPEPSRWQYVEAVDSLRIAYWDWGADSDVPPVTAMPTVVINKPVGGVVQPVSVRNPFFSYNYPRSALDGAFGRFDGRNHTKRCVEEDQNYPGTANEYLAEYSLKEKVNATMRFSYASDEMFATPKGAIVTPQSAIWPFEGSGGAPLTSESVTHVQDWGYTYAPMRFWEQAPGETKMAVSRTVNDLYGPQTQQEAETFSPRGVNRRTDAPRREYFAKIEVERAELELPCQVRLFLKGGLAGSFTLLDMPRQGRSYDEVPLSRGVQAADVSRLSTDGALGLIEDGLEVVINKLDGTTIPLGQVPSLTIEVEGVDVVPPASLDELPTLGASRSRLAMARPFAGGKQ
ncbi:Tyrosinase 8 [Colletotrichum chlorophyti]|uniref:Tyrosinase 8 n=1 Tax=Colletotrichum chlorophyti TaxID=708187 RepID=A0A1Q8RLF0_9PEZI|nr:Tyrosinase 8 [Colletotrichum chlorophyti]